MDTGTNAVNRLLGTRGRVLGVDFGEVRTGLALSDPGRMLASGIGTIAPGGLERTAQAVAGAAHALCNAVGKTAGLFIVSAPGRRGVTLKPV